MKNRAYHPFTNKTAVILSLTIGGILNAIMFLEYTQSKDIDPVAGVRITYTFITNFVALYLLYLFCFKAVQHKINKAKGFWYFIGGSLFITVLLSMALSKCYILIKPDDHVLLNQYYTTNLIKNLINP